jgi:hypothetical protein
LLTAGSPFELLEKLEADADLKTIKSAAAGLKDMRLLFEYLQVYDVLDKVCHSDEARANL